MMVACLALGVALGGTSYATVLNVPDLSVTTAKIRNNAVTAPKIKTAAVTASEVKNGSLLRVDFKPGQLPAGPRGPAGPAGPAGSPGISGLERFDVATSLSNSNSKSVIVTARPGSDLSEAGPA